MRKHQFLAASAPFLSALFLGGVLSSCEPNSHNPQPVACTTPAIIRSYLTPDSCRIVVLELTDSTRTRLRPTGALWQLFQPRMGKQVRIGYLPSNDSTRTCRGPIRVTGRPVRITCIRYDSLGLK